MITAGSAAIKSLLLEKSIAARASSVNPADGSNAANGSAFSTSVLPSVSISLVDSASDSAMVSTSVSIWAVSAVSSSSGPRVSFADVSSAPSPEVWTSSVQTSSVVSGTGCISDADVCASLAVVSDAVCSCVLLAAVSDTVCTCVSAVVSSSVLSTAADDVSSSDAMVFTGVSVVDTLISTAISVEVNLFPFLFFKFIVMPFLLEIPSENLTGSVCCLLPAFKTGGPLRRSITVFLSVSSTKKGHGISATTFPQYSVFSRMSKLNTM